MYDKTEFSKRLKELRLANSETQQKFASNVGSTPATISAYENGTKNPSLEIVANIATEYNVSLDWLCGIEKREAKYNIKTFTDVIKILFALDDAGLNLTLSNCEDDPSCEECDRIIFKDKELQGFLLEWSKMTFLYNNKLIDNDLYNLWKEKTCKKYDIKIEKEKK